MFPPEKNVWYVACRLCPSSMLLAYITSKNSFLPRVYFKFFSVVQFHPHINLHRNILLFVFVFFIFKYSFMQHCVTFSLYMCVKYTTVAFDNMLIKRCCSSSLPIWNRRRLELVLWRYTTCNQSRQLQKSVMVNALNDDSPILPRRKRRHIF